VKEIIRLNQKGKAVARLIHESDIKPVVEKLGFEDGSNHDSLTRFDDPKRSENKKRGNNRRRKFKPKS